MYLYIFFLLQADFTTAWGYCKMHPLTVILPYCKQRVMQTIIYDVLMLFIVSFLYELTVYTCFISVELHPFSTAVRSRFPPEQ